MKGFKKKVIAMAMVATLAFATTAFAAEAPEADFNKSVGLGIYGLYECYDYAAGDVNRAEIGIGTEDGSSTISVGNVAIGGDHYYRGYAGELIPVMGNVYVSSDEDITMLVIFGDGVMSITVTDDPYGFNYDVLNGVYDQTHVTDFSKVG